MPQNLFKIYDGRVNFWQWDTKQKLIVLDDSITEVHFSNRDMNHAVQKVVYEKDGQRLCNVPDVLLQLPRNLVAYAYADGSTVKSVKFAVLQRQIPEGYVESKEDDIDDRLTKIDEMISVLNDSKADNLYYDEDGKSIQLVANGELIGNPVEIPECDASVIYECKVNEDGHLIVVLSDGRIIDAGYVGSADGVTFVPHISEDKILSWTNDGNLENPDPVDLNPFDEWTTLPEEEVETEYEWEFI